MPDLLQSLHKHDLGHLRITASLWGVELTASKTEPAARELVAVLLDLGNVREMLASLPEDASRALLALLEAEGKLPWAFFTRQFGEIRPAGPGRRDRQQVYLYPISTAELLFYRALVANAFFDTPSGLQEYAYLPEDLLPLLEQSLKVPGSKSDGSQQESRGRSMSLGRPAVPKERGVVQPASDRLLDDAVTLLAALRMGLEPPSTNVPLNVVSDFLRLAGLLLGNDPSPEKVKSFLEMPPQAAMGMLAELWQGSESFNELRQLPGLVCEGEWRSDPLAARQALLAFITSLPVDRWWSLSAFVQDIKEKHPDFQRPAGEYDSWFIKRLSDGVYLRGFSSWDDVDGALIRYLVTGPLFWLGKVDLASVVEGGVVTAFRVKAKSEFNPGTARLTVSSNGNISIPRLVPRLVHYQVSRFCEWGEIKLDEYRYRVTVASLQKAGEQGLKVNQLLSLLAKHVLAELPPAFVKALKRWESRGTEARLETQVILRLSRPEVLEELRKSKARRFLGEVLSPVAVIVKPGAQSRVLSALSELGLLAEQVAVEEAYR